jgi:signal transduction histidine kinase
MSPERVSEDLQGFAHFKITKSQYLLAFLAVGSLLLLGFATINSANSTDQRTQVLSDVETPAASIIFTQRETLVYATKLALWSNGGTTRRNVQIARNLLAQRLAVIDSSGRTMGSRANGRYWSALDRADQIVAAAPMGVLPESQHPEINQSLLPVIDQILAEARNLVVSYQKSIDQEVLSLAKESSRRDARNLALFYFFIVTGGLFLLLNVRTNFKNYRIAKVAISAEQRRLEELIQSLESAQSQVVKLQDLDAAKNSLISTVNHELRTPLTSIMGYIELMQREDEAKRNPQIHLYLEVLERNSQVLLSLVESMLSLSKFDSAVGKLPNDLISLKQVIDDAIFTMQPAAVKGGIEITLKVESSPMVRGDKGQLSQVFINLIANAVKFSKSGNQVAVHLSEDSLKSLAQISITDSGIGIPANDLSQLFTRFYRASNVDSGKYPGSGLGLAIVKQVIDHHNGDISVRSELGLETTFSISLPLGDGGEING